MIEMAEHTKIAHNLDDRENFVCLAKRVKLYLPKMLLAGVVVNWNNRS